MPKFVTRFAAVALLSLVGCAMDAGAPGEPWDRIDDGADDPALLPSGDASDPASGPERLGTPRFDPLGEDDDEDEDPSGPYEPIDDLECDSDTVVAEAARDCGLDQVFAGGCCWDDLPSACSALACDTECMGITTVPLSAVCVPS